MTPAKVVYDAFFSQITDDMYMESQKKKHEGTVTVCLWVLSLFLSSPVKFYA